MVHGFNKVSPFFPFVHTDTVLDGFIQSWQFRGGVFFTDVISSVHHIQYLSWWFLMESVASSKDVV